MYVPKSIVCLRDYSARQFRADLGAGIVVGLVALPLAMAFAIASGLGPERGLYTAVVAGFLISALGGSRVQIGGPTGAFVVIVAGIVTRFGYDGLVIATLMAGVILIAMGLLRLGALIKFIPHPLITGFTSGIAVIIFSSQVKDFLGLTMTAVPPDFLEKWGAYRDALPSWNPWALAISAATTVTIFAWPARWRRIPGSIVALVVLTALSVWANLPVETIGSRFGGIPTGLPHPAWPAWSYATARAMIPSALTIAVLAAIESLLSAVVADGMIGSHHKSNMELVAQGVANLASPVFGGIPATGAIARTATNVRNGGRTPVAGMVHAGVLLLILLVAGPLASHIPLAALAGVLVTVSYHMSEWRSFRSLLTGPKSDIAVLLITFLLTVLVDLTVAVEVGMVLAAFLFMKKMADLTHVKSLTGVLDDEDDDTAAELRRLKVPAGVEMYTIRGTFFFGAANKLMETIRFIEPSPRALLLEMSQVLQMDATGLHVLDQIHQECRKRHIRLMIVGLHAQPFAVLQQAHLYAAFRREIFYGTTEAALKSLGKDTSRAPARTRRARG
jgi:SulP family sulfate permease